jgi:hypothetical protein
MGVTVISNITMRGRTMLRILFCSLNLMVISASNAQAASGSPELRTGMQVVVQHLSLAWINGPSGITTSDAQAQVFVLLGEDLASGERIMDQGLVRLKSANGAVWVVATPGTTRGRNILNGGRLSMVSAGQAGSLDSLLTLYKSKTYGTVPPYIGLSDGTINFEDSFAIGIGPNQGYWLKVGAGFKSIEITTRYEDASSFRFTVPVLVAPPGTTQTPPAAPITVPMTQGYSPPPAISCVGGPPKRTYEPCSPCGPGLRQTRPQRECTQALDVQGRGCGAISCETCTCQPN